MPLWTTVVRLLIGIVLFNGVVTRLFLSPETRLYKCIAVGGFLGLVLLEPAIFDSLRRLHDDRQAGRLLKSLSALEKRELILSMIDIAISPPRPEGAVVAHLRKRGLSTDPVVVALLSRATKERLENVLAGGVHAAD